MKDRLVVGFDSSESAVTAVRWAAAEAELRNSSLRVIASYILPSVMDVYGYGQKTATVVEKRQLADACHAKLAVVVQDALRNHPSIGIDSRAVDDDAVSALVEAADDADLLVVGSSGSGAVASVLLGSVVVGVLKRSPVPVVIVPVRVRQTVGIVAVGFDGSPASKLALRWAADEAARRDAELIVVHVWHDPYRLTKAAFERNSDIAQVDAALVLEEGVRLAREWTTGPVTGQLERDDAAQALVQVSERADVVAVASHGRGGLGAAVLGSVAMALASKAACPVAVIRADSIRS